jgi:hypothetical protein
MITHKNLTNDAVMNHGTMVQKVEWPFKRFDRPRMPRKGGNKVLFLEINQPNVSVLTLGLS